MITLHKSDRCEINELEESLLQYKVVKGQNLHPDPLEIAPPEGNCKIPFLPGFDKIDDFRDTIQENQQALIQFKHERL